MPERRRSLGVSIAPAERMISLDARSVVGGLGDVVCHVPRRCFCRVLKRRFGLKIERKRSVLRLRERGETYIHHYSSTHPPPSSLQTVLSAQSSH